MVITVKEIPMVETILVLTDSEGEFLETAPMYRMGAGEELLQGIKAELQTVQLELQEAHSGEVELQERILQLEGELSEQGTGEELQAVQRQLAEEKEHSRRT